MAMYGSGVMIGLEITIQKIIKTHKELIAGSAEWCVADLSLLTNHFLDLPPGVMAMHPQSETTMMAFV
jgi:hypothetical protein